jgi:hypothetical protein
MDLNIQQPNDDLALKSLIYWAKKFSISHKNILSILEKVGPNPTEKNSALLNNLVEQLKVNTTNHDLFIQTLSIPSAENSLLRLFQQTFKSIHQKSLGQNYIESSREMLLLHDGLIKFYEDSPFTKK